MGLIISTIQNGIILTGIGLAATAYLHHTKPNNVIYNLISEDYVIFKLAENKGIKYIGILGNWYKLPK